MFIRLRRKLVATKADKEAGFTLVELMIATVVFSVILLVVTFGVLSFTNRYYKGINTSATQDTARSVIDNVSQAIQFGSEIPDIVDADGSACIVNQAFVFSQANMTLQQETVAGCDVPLVPIDTPRQLMPTHMRSLSFAVSQDNPGDANDSLWQVHVKVIYGENDLFCYDTASCAPGAAAPSNSDLTSNAATVQCKPQTGSQYCAVSDLTTTVEPRVNSAT